MHITIKKMVLNLEPCIARSMDELHLLHEAAASTAYEGAYIRLNGTGGLQLCVCVCSLCSPGRQGHQAMQRDAQTAAQICQQGKVIRDLPGDLLFSVLWEIGEVTSGAMYMRDPVVPVRLYSCSPLAMLPLPFRLGNRPAGNAASACEILLRNGMRGTHSRDNDGSDVPSSLVSSCCSK